MTKKLDIERLLNPKSIAVVGASDKPGSLGGTVLKNLLQMKYSGDLYPINPKRETVMDLPAINSIDQLPEDVDVAVLAIPQFAVLDTVKALAARKCGSAVIFSAGFAEGGEEGLAAQAELRQIAEDANMVIEGPNCLGLINYAAGIPLTFVNMPMPSLGDKQGVGIVSQSGAMAAVLAANLVDRKMGLSCFISTGNEAGSGVEDYVEYLLDDPQISVLSMIVEQFRSPKRFLELARKARSLGKRIVLLHPGESEAARHSAATHTGALAGDYKVMKTLVEREGVILADDLEVLSDVTELALAYPDSLSDGTAYVTESGAFKALTLDLAERVGFSLPAINDDDSPEIREIMPDFVPVTNPFDITAQGLVDPDIYARLYKALINDSRFGSILYAVIQTNKFTCDIKFPAIISGIENAGRTKPVVVCGIDEGGEIPAEYVEKLREIGVPYFPSSDRAARALAVLTRSDLLDRSRGSEKTIKLDGLPAKGIVPEHAAKAVLGSSGIPFPKSKLVTSKDQALSEASAMGYPVVIKIQSADISHKSDVGGVAVGLSGDERLAAAYGKMEADIARNCPNATIDGILVEAMGKRGVELIIGAKNDPDWGPLVLVGFGGVQAELYKDAVLLPTDLTRDQIESALLSLKGAALLTGFRGSQPVDMTAIIDTIETMNHIMNSNPEIREIDLNPVVAYPDGEGVVALDALILTGSD